MRKYSREFSVGLFMLLGLACLAYMTVKLGKMEVFGNDGYELTAHFRSVSGLKAGASVEIAGVRVGKVTRVKLGKDFRAEVGMLIDPGVELSEDSIASVKTSGLIGDKFISLSPGGSKTLLAAGDELTETESSVDIEALISKYVFGGVK
ncbi:MAG: outer membrane lipid asymmetry maintenance protein MlaD [Desulfovibrio sp.]|jgi:phospholipid/cholesterol/gamma-HCH transport system substrate-binding protein|nr:outer membrane lipid asymmetry maintenance protein MlaD [Desulfovibrio sp.]